MDLLRIGTKLGQYTLLSSGLSIMVIGVTQEHVMSAESFSGPTGMLFTNYTEVGVVDRYSNRETIFTATELYNLDKRFIKLGIT